MSGSLEQNSTIASHPRVAGLFGGDGTGGLDLGDTWAYDGTNCAICRRAESYTMADSDLAFSGVPSDGAVDATSPLWSGGELHDARRG